MRRRRRLPDRVSREEEEKETVAASEKSGAGGHGAHSAPCGAEERDGGAGGTEWRELTRVAGDRPPTPLTKPLGPSPPRCPLSGAYRLRQTSRERARECPGCSGQLRVGTASL